ncbi:MAG: RimK/LysX family protein [Candidatus Methanoperedens sp.]|nr:RimK/LysX family protein [Candidatus Methanoperedens sp.]
MDTQSIKKILTFTAGEKSLITSFNIPPDAFLPLLLSLRDGGDYSYSAEDMKTVAVMDKTTVYDDRKKLGYSLEEIYLFVNPTLKEEEGTVHRLEKCGEEEVRLLVRRPYRVKVASERIIKASVNPLEKEIKVEELAEKELVFDGSTAYDIAHEIEHLKHKEIKGESLWEFRFVGDQ